MSAYQSRVKCPNCPPDKAPSLSVDQLRGLYHCFRCGIAGKTQGQFRLDWLEDLPKVRRSEIEWPEYYEPLDPWSPKSLRHKFALKYLLKRNITSHQIQKYKIGFCERGAYEGRVIVPFITKGKDLTYFVARSISPTEKRKYLNPPVPKGDLTFRTYVGKVEKAVVVEGVFDALSVERLLPAIALLGKSPTPAQVRSLKNYTNEVVVLLDSDAHKDSIDLTEQVSYYIPTSKILLKSGDPGGLSYEQLKGELHEYLDTVS